MITEKNRQIAKKRTLKKIRAQFLRKKDDAEEETDVNPDTKHLSGDTMCVLVPAMGLIETNRKVSVGPQNFKLFCKSSGFMIDPRPFNRVARIDFSAGADINPLPWDYTLKRLLSYGNLELATLAHRFDMFRNAASRRISQLHDSLTKDDPISRKMWKEMKERAETLCEEAEKNCIFFKVVFLITKDIQQTLSNSYSEGLLEEMGYSPETFLKWTEENGMPNLFTYDSPVYASVIRAFLGLAYITNQVFVSPVEEAFLYDSKKAKKKILVQNVAALEPISNGFLFHSYFVSKGFPSKDLKVKKNGAILEDRDLNVDVSSPTKNSNSYDELKNKRVKTTSLNIV